MTVMAQKIDGLDGDYGTGVVKLRMYFTYAATTAIAVGDVMALDVSDSTYGALRSVDIADGNGSETLACGVCSHLLGSSGSAAAWIEVQVKGKYAKVDVDAGTAAQASLTASNTAGDFVTASADLPICAIALEARDGNGEADVYLMDPFKLSALA